MSFTDENVKLLKNFVTHNCATCAGKAPKMPFNGSPYEKITALLAGLEAAEKVLGFEVGSFEYEKYLLVWRKAAGK